MAAEYQRLLVEQEALRAAAQAETARLVFEAESAKAKRGTDLEYSIAAKEAALAEAESADAKRVTELEATIPANQAPLTETEATGRRCYRLNVIIMFQIIVFCCSVGVK